VFLFFCAVIRECDKRTTWSTCWSRHVAARWCRTEYGGTASHPGPCRRTSSLSTSAEFLPGWADCCSVEMGVPDTRTLEIFASTWFASTSVYWNVVTRRVAPRRSSTSTQALQAMSNRRTGPDRRSVDISFRPTSAVYLRNRSATTMWCDSASRWSRTIIRHFDLDVLRLSCRAICVRRVLPLYPTDVKAEPAFDGRIVYCTVRSQRFVNKAVRDVVLVSAQFRALQQRFTLANGFLAILSR